MKRNHGFPVSSVGVVSQAGHSDMSMAGSQPLFTTSSQEMPSLQPVVTTADALAAVSSPFGGRQFPGALERGFVFPPPFAIRSPTTTNFGYAPFGGGGPPGLVPLSPLPVGISGLSLSLPSPQTLDITSCQAPHYSMMGERPAQAFDVPASALAGLVTSADIFSLPVTPRTPITPTVRYAQMHAAQAAGQLMAPPTIGPGVSLASELAMGHGSFQFDHINHYHPAAMAAMSINGETMMSSGAPDTYVPAITLSPPPKSKPLSRSSSLIKTESDAQATRQSNSGNTDEDSGKDLWRPY